MTENQKYLSDESRAEGGGAERALRALLKMDGAISRKRMRAIESDGRRGREVPVGAEGSKGKTGWRHITRREKPIAAAAT